MALSRSSQETERPKMNKNNNYVGAMDRAEMCRETKKEWNDHLKKIGKRIWSKIGLNNKVWTKKEKG